MNRDLRFIGLVQGLLLGLLLATPRFAPALFPWGAQALFLFGGFQLRMADRRWSLRHGLPGWISHIRMAPRRLIPWAAASVCAVIAAQPEQAIATLIASIGCELLLYPLIAHRLGAWPRRSIMILLPILMAATALTDGALHYMIAFTAGICTSLVWLRGSDGEPIALAGSIGCVAAAMLAAIVFPTASSFAFVAGICALLLALAHLSVLRRRPVPWLAGSASCFRTGSRPPLFRRIVTGAERSAGQEVIPMRRSWPENPCTIRTTAFPALPGGR